MKKYLIALVISILAAFTVGSSNDVESVKTESFVDNQQIWITNWIASDNESAQYGKGRFYYRIARSQYKYTGGYLYQIYFISDSYYQSYYYDENGNGIVEDYEIYRSATKIDNIQLYVDGKSYDNDLTGSCTFWLLFNGDYSQGIGDLGVQFFHTNPEANITMNWSTPKPF